MRTATVLVVLTSSGMVRLLGHDDRQCAGPEGFHQPIGNRRYVDRNLIEIGDVGDQDRDRFFGRALFGDVQLQRGGPIEGKCAQTIHGVCRKCDESMFAQAVARRDRSESGVSSRVFAWS